MIPLWDAKMKTQPEEDKVKLPFYHKLAYGLGHVYNDLCAAVWFSYMLIYLQVGFLLVLV